MLATFLSSNTVKTLLSPQGAYLISDLPEGGLNREGGLFTKSSDKTIFGSFSVLLSHILRNQGTILRLKYVDLCLFVPCFPAFFDLLISLGQ